MTHIVFAICSALSNLSIPCHGYAVLVIVRLKTQHTNEAARGRTWQQTRENSWSAPQVLSDSLIFIQTLVVLYSLNVMQVQRQVWRSGSRNILWIVLLKEHEPHETKES